MRRVIPVSASSARTEEVVEIGSARYLEFRTVPVPLTVWFVFAAGGKVGPYTVKAPAAFDDCVDEIARLILTHDAGAGDIEIAISDGEFKSRPLGVSAESSDVIFAHFMGRTGGLATPPEDSITHQPRLTLTASIGATATMANDVTDHYQGARLVCPADANNNQTAKLVPTAGVPTLNLVSILRAAHDYNKRTGLFFVEDAFQLVDPVGTSIRGFFGFGGDDNTTAKPYGAGLFFDEDSANWRLAVIPYDATVAYPQPLVDVDTGIPATEAHHWRVYVGAGPDGTPLLIAECDGAEVARHSGAVAFEYTGAGRNSYFGVHMVTKQTGGGTDEIEMRALLASSYRWGWRQGV